jgi:enoyl-CoA hydratase/carnithine racemase
MGGGAEMLVNLDLAVAGQSATLGFPEAKRGVTVGAGGIPRLVRLVGHTRGMPGSVQLCTTEQGSQI